MNKLSILENLSRNKYYYIYIEKQMIARFSSVIHYKNSIEVLTRIVFENKIPEYNIDKSKLTEVIQEYSSVLYALNTLFEEVLLIEFGENTIIKDPKYSVEIDTQQQCVSIMKL